MWGCTARAISTGLSACLFSCFIRRYLLQLRHSLPEAPGYLAEVCLHYQREENSTAGSVRDTVGECRQSASWGARRLLKQNSVGLVKVFAGFLLAGMFGDLQRSEIYGQTWCLHLFVCVDTKLMFSLCAIFVLSLIVFVGPSRHVCSSDFDVTKVDSILEIFQADPAWRTTIKEGDLREALDNCVAGEHVGISDKCTLGMSVFLYYSAWLGL